MFKCRMCGEEWDILENAATAECPHCGTIQAIVPEVQDAHEAQPSAEPAVPKGVKLLLLVVAVLAATALAWWAMFFSGPDREEPVVNISSNFNRETAQEQSLADTTRGNTYGQNARRKLEEKAALGDPWAQYNLGIMYYTGQGVDRDLREGVKWFFKAAEQGHAEAQNKVGEAYYNGWGVKKDYKEAVKWLQKAATHESAQAQTALGVVYYQGAGVVRSYFNAVWWFNQAAEKGNVWAMYYLANMYRSGLGVKKDILKARELYQKASEQGHIGAMKALENTKIFKLFGIYEEAP